MESVVVRDPSIMSGEPTFRGTRVLIRILGFQVLTTVDQNLAYQQRIESRTIAVVGLRSRTTNLDDLLTLIPDVLAAVECLEPGGVVRVGMP